LYKKTNIYHRDCADAGYGDYHFGYDNFNIFCCLDNLCCIHLGVNSVNWEGKTVSFIDDVNIALRDIYFMCQKKVNNVYYNNACQMVKYGNSENIEHDIWTCSDQMRYDIDVFFKDKRHFKIAEIGAHKGYTTKLLANIFSTVYAVDNSIEWTAMNKALNKAAGNIEYVMLDIYKDSWNILPDDIEVSFIDAVHTYEGCKSDIVNSLKQFKNLQYIVFDDYGVWDGVKKIVDELIRNKTFIFERFIGINDVPGPNGIVKNVREGVICRINKKQNTTDKKYFVIGYNKTATSTFHQLFLNNSLTAQHDTVWDTDSYECFSDGGDEADFKKLDKDHSNSIFILNIRRLDEWLISRLKHGEKYNQSWAYPVSTELCIKWINDREKYYVDVLEYFKDKPNKLIIVNIDQPNWIQEICKKLYFEKNVNIREHVCPLTSKHVNIVNIVNSVFELLQYDADERQNILFKNKQLTEYYLNLYEKTAQPTVVVPSPRGMTPIAPPKVVVPSPRGMTPIAPPNKKMKMHMTMNKLN
jgi:hypothetical protein